jgi:hypothetical protein
MTLPRPAFIIFIALLAFVLISWLAIYPLSPEKRFSRGYSALLLKQANTSENLRALYADALDNMPTSTVLSLIEENKFCHSDSHELGKLVYLRSKANLASAFEVCQKHCMDGCFHGVLMEAFRSPNERSDELSHVSHEDFQKKAVEICATSANIQAPEECAHAIGHGLLVSTEDMHRALELCSTFKIPGVGYYCSTGVFMQRDIDHGEEDAKRADYTYPCSEFAGQYDVQCWRYKVRQLFIKFQTSNSGSRTSRINAAEQMKEMCRGLEKKARLGCWHGLGNGLYAEIIDTPEYLADLCIGDNSDNERLACIDGAMENVSLVSARAATQACAALGYNRLAKFCASIDGKNNSLERETLPMYY